MNRLILVLALLILLSLTVGAADIQILSLIQSWLSNNSIDESDWFVLWQLRFPRTMACLMVGASLGVSGALLQTLLRNPLAEPYTLGVSGGATLGAILAIFLGLSPNWLMIPLSAFAGCVSATGLILYILRKHSVSSPRTLILTGIMISLFCGSVVVLLMTLLDPYQVQASIVWMVGQVGTERDTWWVGLLPILLSALFWGRRNSISLDHLLLGHETAISLGTPVRRIRRFIVFLVGALCAVSVSISGLIGFVGLLAPHFSILIATPRHKIHLPTSALSGATFLLTADILGRFIGGEREIPAGGLIALFGAPILVFLLLRMERHA